MTHRTHGIAIVAGTILLATGLSGCATSGRNCSGDPRYDSLACASGNLGGYYQRRTADMRHDVVATDARARSEQVGADRSSAQADRLRREGDNRAADVGAINAEISGLERQVASERGRLAQLQARGAPAGEIEALTAEIRRLTAKIDRLRGRN